MTKLLKDSIHGFKDTYSELDTPEAKRIFLFAEIDRTKRAIATFEKEPNLITGKLYERNRTFFSDAVKYLNYLEGIKKRDFPEEEETTSKTTKDKLTHKQQILLLHSIGFFDLEIFEHLNETQKGVLVSHIVNRDEKNSEDNIRYVRGKRASEETKRIFTKNNLKAVNELLEKAGLKQYKVS